MTWRVTAMPAALACLAACSAPPGRAPCADFNCSGHGSCALIWRDGRQVPTCRCDPGYAPSESGWLCLPPGDTSLCAGIDCSGHGSCVSVAGQPRCLCEDGYLPVAPHYRSCVDPCADIDCGAAGRCEIEADQPRCVCDAGARLEANGTRCVVEQLPYLTYRLVADIQPDVVLGNATIDLTGLPAGELVETIRYDIFQHNLAGRWRQVWSLAGDTLEIARAHIDQILDQGTVERRRQTLVAFADGTATIEMRRLDRRFSLSQAYLGERSPIPMPGGREFPALAPGALSPASYMVALDRYDFSTGAAAQQQLDVFWPSSGSTATLSMRAARGPGSAEATLELPQIGVRVAYRDAIPDRIELLDLGLSWRYHEGMPRDSNLPLMAATTPLLPDPPPLTADTSLLLTAPDGTSLQATLSRPPTPAASSTPAPAVLLVCAPEAADRDHPHRQLPRSPLYAHLAAHLAAAGYVSLRYQPRALSDRSRLLDLVGDARVAYQALAAAPDVDRTRIFVVGHGHGATVALGLLGLGSTARGVVGLAPLIGELDEAAIYAATAHLSASGYRKTYIDEQRKRVAAELDQIAAGTYPGQRWRDLPVALWRDLLAVDGHAALAPLEQPVLLLRGAEDLLTPPEQLARAESAAAAAGKQNLETDDLAGLAFNLASGSAADLWERAHFPLELPQSLVARLVDWLEVNR